MHALATMARHLERRPEASPGPRPDPTSIAGRLRQKLQDDGRQTARQLAQAVGLSNSSLVGGCLGYDIRAGRVDFADGYYSWRDRPEVPLDGRTLVRDVLDWHEIADDDFPDADLTVLVRIRGAEEPVWLGYWDGEEWRDVDGLPIDVVRWAEIPKGGEV